MGALIETGSDEERKEEVVVGGDAINEIDIKLIETNPYQPRTNFDQESLEELSSSIKEIGIIQPITVRLLEEKGKFQLITGERRLRAATLAGLKTIPAYIRLADDQAMLEMALVENIQRQDLDSIEVAISYQRLIDECKLTQENMSERVGKKRSTITNYLRLLRLPAEIQLGIREKKLGMGQAKTLISIEDQETQKDVYDIIVENDLSVRATEELVRNLNKPKVEKNPDDNHTPGLPREYEDLKNHLNQFFRSNIEFKRNNKGAGKIVIPFKSDEDLERIVAILDNLKS